MHQRILTFTKFKLYPDIASLIATAIRLLATVVKVVQNQLLCQETLMLRKNCKIRVEICVCVLDSQKLYKNPNNILVSISGTMRLRNVMAMFQETYTKSQKWRIMGPCIRAEKQREKSQTQ